MKEFKNNLKFTWNYVKYQKANFIKYVLLNICLVIISVVVPILSANVIIYLTSSLFQQLAMVALVILMVEVSRNVINYFSTKYVQIIYRETFTLIQNDLGKEILTLDNKSLKSVLDQMQLSSILENDNIKHINKITYEAIKDVKDYLEIEIKD